LKSINKDCMGTGHAKQAKPIYKSTLHTNIERWFRKCLQLSEQNSKSKLFCCSSVWNTGRWKVNCCEFKPLCCRIQKKFLAYRFVRICFLLLLIIAQERVNFPGCWRLNVATRDGQTLKEVSHDEYCAGSFVMQFVLYSLFLKCISHISLSPDIKNQFHCDCSVGIHILIEYQNHDLPRKPQWVSHI
jgi:hypothetical protein